MLEKKLRIFEAFVTGPVPNRLILTFVPIFGHKQGFELAVPELYQGFELAVPELYQS